MKLFAKRTVSIVLVMLMLFAVLSTGVTTSAATTDTSDVALSGTFNNWDLTTNIMTADSNNVYTTTVDLTSDTYEFKVVCNGLWYGSNQIITDKTNDLAMSITYGNCTLKATGGTYTFVYNTSDNTLTINSIINEDATAPTEPASTVSLSGDFNEWSTTANIMENTSDTTYTTSVDLDYGTHYFNIVSNGLWYGKAIAFTDNTKNCTLKMSGGQCALVASGGTYEFSFDTSSNTLNITKTADAADPADKISAYLAGSFNNWNYNSSAMTKESSTSLTTKVTLFSGIYKFKIVSDGLWYGNDNGWFLNNTIAPGCTLYSDQGNCTLQATGGTYTFHFDIMTKILSIEYEESSLAPADMTKVSLAGDFNNWSTTANIMTKSSSYYVSTSVELKAGTYNFKIVQDDLWYGSNSVLPNTANDFQLSAVEGNCTIQTLGGTYTFMYDVVNHKLTMLYSPKETDPAETAVVSVAGDFNQWSKTANMLVFSETNTVSTTINLTAGTYSFKIVQDELWYGNNGIISDTTTTTSDTGWKMAITNGNCTLEASGGKYTFNYNVITNNLTVLFEGTVADPADNAVVSLAGSFNEWSTTANILQKKSAKIVSTTITLPQGTYYFKMVRNGLWYGNDGTIEDRTNLTSINGWVMSPVAVECGLYASGGTYTFDYDVTTNTLVVDCELDSAIQSSPVSLAGDFNDWSLTENIFTDLRTNTVTTQIKLNAGTYKFKIVKDGLWYGNNGTIKDMTSITSAYGWTMSVFEGDCTLEASGGTYTFEYNYVSKRLIVTYKQDPLTDSTKVSLVGDFNGWNTETTDMKKISDNEVSATLSLERGHYYFNVIRNSKWYGSDSDIAFNNYTDRTTLSETTSDCLLLASGGDYEFIYDLSNNSLTINYTPLPVEPANSAVVTISGDFNNWNNTTDTLLYSSSDVVSKTLKLEKGTYKFKILHNNIWYGNNGTIVDTTATTSDTGWTLSENDGDCTLQATGGYYVFYYNVVTKSLEVKSVISDEVPADSAQIFLAGDFNSWNTSSIKFDKFNDTQVVACVTLDRGTYAFKLTDNRNWFGSADDKDIYNITSSKKLLTDGNDCIIHCNGGEYYFVYDLITKSLDVQHMR